MRALDTRVSASSCRQYCTGLRDELAASSKPLSDKSRSLMPGEDQYLCNEQWHKVSELFTISSQLLIVKEFHSPNIYTSPGYERQNEQVSKRVTAI